MALSSKKSCVEIQKRGFVTPHCTELVQLTTWQRTNQKALLSVHDSFVHVHKKCNKLVFSIEILLKLGVLAQIAL